MCLGSHLPPSQSIDVCKPIYQSTNNAAAASSSLSCQSRLLEPTVLAAGPVLVVPSVQKNFVFGAPSYHLPLSTTARPPAIIEQRPPVKQPESTVTVAALPPVRLTPSADECGDPISARPVTSPSSARSGEDEVGDDSALARPVVPPSPAHPSANEVGDDLFEPDDDEPELDFIQLADEKEDEDAYATDPPLTQLYTTPEENEEAIRSLYSKLKPTAPADPNPNAESPMSDQQHAPYSHLSTDRTSSHRSTEPRALPPPQVLQNIYKKSRKKAVRIICENSPRVDCLLPRESIIAHFQSPRIVVPQAALDAIPPPSTKFKRAESQIVSNITPEDVWLKLARIDRNTSPGFTGISFSDFMSKFSCRRLSLIFNSVLASGFVPSQWKQSYLVLLPKKGDVSGIILETHCPPRHRI